MNPPDDIATLPELDQRKFVKAFALVPEQVKVKSTQKYGGRMDFMRRQTYAEIKEKLRVKLSRDKTLAIDPAITARDVLKMCDDIIVYGRPLVMGKITSCDFHAIALQYGFDNAAKAIKRLDDRGNFHSGLATGYPHSDPECRDFETLAKKINGAQWQAFLDRVKVLQAKHDGLNESIATRTRTEVYGPDQCDGVLSDMLPDDFDGLPPRDRVRYSKIYGMLPPQVAAIAKMDYGKRREYLRRGNPKYEQLRKKLAERMARGRRRLKEYPAVTEKEVLTVCEELVRYGRPLAHGEMRHVSLKDLANTYRFMQVRDFMDTFEKVEGSKSVKHGFSGTYSINDPEWEDFAKLADNVKKDAWRDFNSRLGELNKRTAQKTGGRR